MSTGLSPRAWQVSHLTGREVRPRLLTVRDHVEHGVNLHPTVAADQVEYISVGETVRAYAVEVRFYVLHHTGHGLHCLSVWQLATARCKKDPHEQRK